MSRNRVQGLTLDSVLSRSPHFQENHVGLQNKAVTILVGTVVDVREVIIAIDSLEARAVEICIEYVVNDMWTVSTLRLRECSIIVADNHTTECLISSLWKAECVSMTYSDSILDYSKIQDVFFSF